MTHVLTCLDASRAARRPAPPAPTTTASYLWKVVTSAASAVEGGPKRLADVRPPAGVEREHHDGPEGEEHEAGDQPHAIDGGPQARPAHVVEGDRSQAVDPMQQGQGEHQPIPG